MLVRHLSQYLSKTNIIYTQARFLSIFAITAMVTTMIVPKIYNDYERHQSGFIETHNLRNKILYQIHEIDLGSYPSIYTGIQKHAYVWIHRFLQFPEEQPKVWYLCSLYLMGLFTLPWFRAVFIPSGKDQNESTGLFYLWGLLFADDQWIPIADTWLYAIFSLTFNVAVFILFFVWKSTSVHLLYCKGVEKTGKTSLVCDRLWFQLLVLVYWMWRTKEVAELATFYGGIWPTLILNMMFWWLMTVALLIVFGKNGVATVIMSRHKHQELQPVGIGLEICPACYDGADINESSATQFVNEAIDCQDDIQHQLTVLPLEEESRRLLLDEEAISSDTSSGNNTTSLRRKASKKD